MQTPENAWALAETEVLPCPPPGCDGDAAWGLWVRPAPLAPEPLDPVLARTEAARRLWVRCRPIEGTAAEGYLRARGIRAPGHGALRFHPALYYRSAHDPDAFRRLPALVARVTTAEGAFVGVERIYLDPTRPETAPVADARKRLGPRRGAAVDLGPPGAPALVVTLAVEAALSALVARPAIRAAATLSLEGLGAFTPPEGTARVLVAAGAGAGRGIERHGRRTARPGAAS